MNSSYGTFLSNGKKLAPNSATLLNSGDKFYLASPKNTFEIRY
ncbi:MAG: FHA domain-containing protein [Clostridiales bacterium]|nr:FHA domain-containing protein [Clostridiales bacterium]